MLKTQNILISCFLFKYIFEGNFNNVWQTSHHVLKTSQLILDDLKPLHLSATRSQTLKAYFFICLPIALKPNGCDRVLHTHDNSPSSCSTISGGRKGRKAAFSLLIVLLLYHATELGTCVIFLIFSIVKNYIFMHFVIKLTYWGGRLLNRTVAEIGYRE